MKRICRFVIMDWYNHQGLGKVRALEWRWSTGRGVVHFDHHTNAPSGYKGIHQRTTRKYREDGRYIKTSPILGKERPDSIYNFTVSPDLDPLPLEEYSYTSLYDYEDPENVEWETIKTKE